MSILTNIQAEVENNGIDWQTVLFAAPDSIMDVLLGGNPAPFKQWLESYFGVTLTGYDAAAINDQAKLAAVPQVVYSFFSIWAEENGPLAAGSTEWSYGNGNEASLTTGGLFMGVGCELISLGLNIQSGSGEVEVIKNGVATTATTGVQTSPGGLNTLTTPLAFNAGDRINFRTVSSNLGSIGRVIAWFRTPVGSLTSVQGPPGPPGTPGINGTNGIDGFNGVPGQFARVNVGALADVNGGPDIPFTTLSSGNIPGMVINANSITLPAGSYEVQLTGNINTTAARTNVGIDFFIGGTFYSSMNGSNYIRSASGHNSATIQFNDVFSIASGTSDISFTPFQAAAPGIVALQNDSWLSIKKFA